MHTYKYIYKKYKYIFRKQNLKQKTSYNISTKREKIITKLPKKKNY